MTRLSLAIEQIQFARTYTEKLIAAVPNEDWFRCPPIDGIVETYRAVHRQAMRELPDYPDAQLDLAPLIPHVLGKTRLWSLLWCAQHEMIHAGQIGLSRRIHGQKPPW